MKDLHYSGPVSSLPGSLHSLPEGSMCDSHPDRLAVARVQGETDSFGAEYILMCAECREAHKAMDGAHYTGNCKCGAEEVPLFPYRDYDEGLRGPVYYACRACKGAFVARQSEEAERYLLDEVFILQDDFDEDWAASDAEKEEYARQFADDLQQEQRHEGPFTDKAGHVVAYVAAPDEE